MFCVCVDSVRCGEQTGLHIGTVFTFAATRTKERILELFFQQLLNGLTIGGVYSLVALGLTLVYGILHEIGRAHV